MPHSERANTATFLEVRISNLNLHISSLSQHLSACNVWQGWQLQDRIEV